MRNEYKTTTNSRIFKILHKEQHAFCSYCKWHGPNSENDAWGSYYLDTDPGKFNLTKFPNWKLCSKNKKQWMGKPVKMRKLSSRRWRTHDLYILEW